MQTSDANHREALLAELELHKSEYSALREEILERLDSQRQYLNLNLVAIAAALGIAPYILEQRAFVSMLLFPIVFHVLLWEMLSSVRMIWRLSSYISDKLVPRVNNILDELGDDRQGTTVLGWEVHVKARVLKKSEWIMASISPTQHWVPILTIAGLLISYIAITGSYGHSPSLGEILLILGNLLFLVLAAMRNAAVARSGVQETQRLLEQSERTTPNLAQEVTDAKEAQSN